MRRVFFLLLELLICDYVLSQNIDTIRYENIFNLIKIPIQLNGKIHYFIFDTGAECTAIREDVAAELDTAGISVDTLNDSFNKETIQSKYKVKSLSIGNSNLIDQSIITFPNSLTFNCLGAEGIIGIDIIKQFDWLIDYENKYICKLDTTDIMNGINEYLPLDFYKNGFRPRIKLKIGDTVVDFLFDSGANTNDVDIESYNRIKNNSIKSYSHITSRNGATSFDKRSQESIFLISTQPDNLINNKVNAEFNSISIGENKIGNTYWGLNQIFFSWTNNKLLFKKFSSKHEKSFGISFRIINDTLTVNSLIFTEQIIKSGIKIGDKVKTINGKSFTNYCDLMTYQISRKEDILTIDLLNGKQIRLTKENIF